MKKLFFDTNIILDHLFGRRFYTEAVTLLRLCERREIEGYISTASIYTITYFVQKSFSLSESKKIISDYLSIVAALETRQGTLQTSLQSDFTDLEDAYQYFTALAENSISFFVTGNTKDFTAAEFQVLPVVSPAEVLLLI